MIRTLAWKEYREQRALWLAIAILAALFTLYFGLLAKGGISGAHDDRYVREIVIGGLFSLMVAQGVVCGAQLFAGEKEPRTLAFLEVLARQRASLWVTKLFMGGLLTLGQALILFGLMLVLQLGSGHFPLLVGVGLLALFWGMVGGAVCEQVFPAILLGVVLAAGSLALVFLLPIPRGVALTLVALVPLAISRQKFCASDRDRRLRRDELQGVRRRKRGPHGWRALLWLAEKQGRWIIWPGLALSFLAGFVMFPAPDLLWPPVTLIIGLVCGHAVFGPEQAGAQEPLLGAQRYPPGRVWLFKAVFWALIAAAMMVLLYAGMFLQHDLTHISRGPLFRRVFFPNARAGMFLTMWALYGFSFGQFCTLLSRKIVVAAVLSVGTCVLVLTLWLPSLIFHDLKAWQILPIPLILFVAVRVSMWPWFSGRLLTRRHLLGLIGCCLMTVLWLGGNLWYRAVEIPDVGEPFDLKAFNAKLNRAARSDAAVLIRQGARAMEQQQEKVTAQLPPPSSLLVPYLLSSSRERQKIASQLRDAYMQVCYHVLAEGWPPGGSELGPWLDALFAGEWVDDLRNAVRMPLGLMADPRTVRVPTVYHKLDDPEGHRWHDIGVLISVRALQLQARGDNATALDHLATNLALSRQLRHCALTEFAVYGGWVERSTLFAFDEWLRKIGPRRDFLQQALRMLRDHEHESPDPLDTIKADYVVGRNHTANLYGSQFELQRFLVELALQAPWERERQSRFVNALFQGQIRLARLAPSALKEMLGRAGNQDWPTRYWNATGLSLIDSNWTLEQWGRLIRESRHPSVTMRGGFGVLGFLDDLRRLRLRQVYIALMLYQIDRGHAAGRLDDLVPRYLPTMPLDPWLNQSFHYKVSQGERIRGYFWNEGETRTQQLQPGQGLLWLEEGPLGFRSYYREKNEICYFPMPLWTKK